MLGWVGVQSWIVRSGTRLVLQRSVAVMPNNSFNILIADLLGDDDGGQAEHIRQSLEVQFDAAQSKAPVRVLRSHTLLLADDAAKARAAIEWAHTQNNRGTALLTLGTREAGTARLTAAVDAYRKALEIRTQVAMPLDWAATQNNLGIVLWTLGARDGTARGSHGRVPQGVEGLYPGHSTARLGANTK